MPRYEYSSEFWDIEIDGSSHTTRYGRIGTNGQTKTKEFADEATARQDYEKSIASMARKGYALVAETANKDSANDRTSSQATVASLHVRNRALEDTIRRNPDDAEAWSVYADWPQSQGDPRGELAALQLTLAAEPTAQSKSQLARASALLEQHAAMLWPPKLRKTITDQAATEPDRDNKIRHKRWQRNPAAVTWHGGFIKTATLSKLGKDHEFEIAELVTELFQHPSGRFVNKLKIFFNSASPTEYDDIIRALSAADMGGLRTLNCTQMHGENAELCSDLTGLTNAAPNLETLSLVGGRWVLGDSFRPVLRELWLHTSGLPSASMESVTARMWPSLRRLVLYGDGLNAELIRPVLEGSHFPTVRELGLPHFGSDSVAAALSRSAIAAQLERLNFVSPGTLTSTDINALAAADAFTNLKLLNVCFNDIAESDAATLKAAFPSVFILDDQNLDEVIDAGDDVFLTLSVPD